MVAPFAVMVIVWIGVIGCIYVNVLKADGCICRLNYGLAPSPEKVT